MKFPASFSKLRSLLSLLALLGVTGCFAPRQTTLVPTSSALLRLGDDVSGHIYAWDGTNWVKSMNKVKLPMGWYTGSMDTPATSK